MEAQCPRDEDMNHRKQLWHALAVALAALALLVAASPDERPQAQGAPPIVHKVLLRAGDETGRQALRACDARLVTDYGAFSLWLVDGGGVTALEAASDGLSVHPEFDQLLLREGRIDTSVSRPDANAAAQAGSGDQLYVVQFVGPVRDDWLADLQATGARVVAYVPYNGRTGPPNAWQRRCSGCAPTSRSTWRCRWLFTPRASAPYRPSWPTPRP
jgi:hypothetical protein